MARAALLLAALAACVAASAAVPSGIKGIAWFGFNNDYKMVSDLYAGPDSTTKDFKTARARRASCRAVSCVCAHACTCACAGGGSAQGACRRRGVAQALTTRRSHTHTRHTTQTTTNRSCGA